MQAKNRSNLRVLPFSPVQQLILEKCAENLTATGVVYIDYAGGQTVNATANKEVILSAGSIQTPQLLMLSVSCCLSMITAVFIKQPTQGIGPTDTLDKAGIQVYLANAISVRSKSLYAVSFQVAFH
jgi:hypothetical protein